MLRSSSLVRFRVLIILEIVRVIKLKHPNMQCEHTPLEEKLCEVDPVKPIFSVHPSVMNIKALIPCISIHVDTKPGERYMALSVSDFHGLERESALQRN